MSESVDDEIQETQLDDNGMPISPSTARLLDLQLDDILELSDLDRSSIGLVPPPVSSSDPPEAQVPDHHNAMLVLLQIPYETKLREIRKWFTELGFDKALHIKESEALREHLRNVIENCPNPMSIWNHRPLHKADAAWWKHEDYKGWEDLSEYNIHITVVIAEKPAPPTQPKAYLHTPAPMTRTNTS